MPGCIHHRHHYFDDTYRALLQLHSGHLCERMEGGLGGVIKRIDNTRSVNQSGGNVDDAGMSILPEELKEKFR